MQSQYLTKSDKTVKIAVIKSYVQNDLLGFSKQQNVGFIFEMFEASQGGCIGLYLFIILENNIELKVPARVLSCFLPSGPSVPHLLQSALARLLNSLASARAGRDYLANYTTLIETLVDCLVFVGRNMEPATLEMIIAALQKLSLK